MNSEKVYSFLHSDMMQLAEKKTDEDQAEAEQLALGLLIRAECPLAIRVHAHMVLAIGNHDDYLHHAREAVRCVRKGRVIFGERTTESKLAVARLLEEAQEVLRRAERDARQLEQVKKDWKKGLLVEEEVTEYGGNHTDEVLSDRVDDTEEEIVVAPRPELDSNDSQDEDDEGDEGGEGEENDDGVDEEVVLAETDVEEKIAGEADAGGDQGDVVGEGDAADEDEVSPAGDGLQADAPADGEQGDDDEDAPVVPEAPPLRRSNRVRNYDRDYKTGKERK